MMQKRSPSSCTRLRAMPLEGKLTLLPVVDRSVLRLLHARRVAPELKMDAAF